MVQVTSTGVPANVHVEKLPPAVLVGSTAAAVTVPPETVVPVGIVTLILSPLTRA